MFPESEVLENIEGFDVHRIERIGNEKKGFIATLLRRSDNILDRAELKPESFLQLKGAEECLRVHKSKLEKADEEKKKDATLTPNKGSKKKRKTDDGDELPTKVCLARMLSEL
jgi:hypothetical protein